MRVRGTHLAVAATFLSLATSCTTLRDASDESTAFQIRSLLARPLPEIVWEGRDSERLTKELFELYEGREFEPVWVGQSGLSEPGLAALETLAQASNHGLRRDDYLTSLPTESALADAEAKARFDLSLSFTTMRYIKDLHEGRFNPRELGMGADMPHDHKDLSAEIDALASSDDATATLESFAPTYPQYQGLKKALARYRYLAERGPWRRMKGDESLHPGEPYEDIELLRYRLRMMGDLRQDAASEGPIYDPALVEAVKRFQHRHSLNPDGVIGPHSFTHFNTPWSDRVAQIAASMERWRWLPEHMDGTPIIANIPEYRLRAVVPTATGYDIQFESSIIVGKHFEEFRTPIFSAKLRYIDFRPFWNVPKSIVRNELSPFLDEPGYIEKHRYEIVASTSLEAKPLPVTPENIARVRGGALTLRQRPGSANTLGLVKFVFPNDYSVFLHDTVSRHLFQREERTFSHGCVRVANALDLAEWVLRGQEGWDRAAIDEAVASGPTKRVLVERDIPVHIVYLTAFVEQPSGDVHFAHDIYGLDAELARALGYELVELDHGQVVTSDEHVPYRRE